MADDLQHIRDSHEPTDEARRDSADGASRAVARLLANPRRTRRA